MRTNLVLGCIRTSIASQPKEGIIPLSSVPVRLCLGSWVQFGAPQDRGEIGKQRIGVCRSQGAEGFEDLRELGHTTQNQAERTKCFQRSSGKVQPPRSYIEKQSLSPLRDAQQGVDRQWTYVAVRTIQPGYMKKKHHESVYTAQRVCSITILGHIQNSAGQGPE